MSLEGLPGAFAIRSQLNLRGVAIDGLVATRLTSYETCLTRLCYHGMSDSAKADCAPDFDKGTQSKEQLRTTATDDLKFLLGAIQEQATAKAAGTPEYLQ